MGAGVVGAGRSSSEGEGDVAVMPPGTARRRCLVGAASAGMGSAGNLSGEGKGGVAATPPRTARQQCWVGGLGGSDVTRDGMTAACSGWRVHRRGWCGRAWWAWATRVAGVRAGWQRSCQERHGSGVGWAGMGAGWLARAPRAVGEGWMAAAPPRTTQRWRCVAEMGAGVVSAGGSSGSSGVDEGDVAATPPRDGTAAASCGRGGRRRGVRGRLERR